MYGNQKREQKSSFSTYLKWAGLAILAIFLLIVGFSGMYVIDPGYRGVKVVLGKVAQKSYVNGLGFKVPLISSMVPVDVRTRIIADSTETYTSDVQLAQIDYVLTYNLNPENVYVLYEQVGLNYEPKLINNHLFGAIKDVVGQIQAQVLVSRRDSAREVILQQLKERVDKQFIQNVGFELKDITYSKRFETAIEDKVIADQKAQEAINNTRRVTEEAEQKRIVAEAEANAMKVKAAALAENKKLVEYEAVQKWDGKLPNYMMGETVPFINLGNQK